MFGDRIRGVLLLGLPFPPQEGCAKLLENMLSFSSSVGRESPFTKRLDANSTVLPYLPLRWCLRTPLYRAAPTDTTVTLRPEGQFLLQRQSGSANDALRWMWLVTARWVSGVLLFFFAKDNDHSLCQARVGLL